MQIRSLGWDDPLEKAMATHPSTLAWKIPWTEEPSRLQSMGSQIYVLRSRLYISSVQSLSRVRLFVTPRTTACQASLSITNSWNLLKFKSIELVMPSNHLIHCHPLLLLPSIFPSIRVFSNGLALPIRWPEYGSFSFSSSPSHEYSGLISFRMDWSPPAVILEPPK